MTLGIATASIIGRRPKAFTQEGDRMIYNTDLRRLITQYETYIRGGGEFFENEDVLDCLNELLHTRNILTEVSDSLDNLTHKEGSI